MVPVIALVVAVVGIIAFLLFAAKKKNKEPLGERENI